MGLGSGPEGGGLHATLAGITVTNHVEGLHVGLVVGRGLSTGPASAALAAALDAAVQSAGEAVPNQTAVRQMLRFGRYRPSGRGKPASEYLHRAARSGTFPRINNLVDGLNSVSLTTGLPISVIDLDLADDDRFSVRRGRADEAYVFNGAGQTITLEDLLLLADGQSDRPLANPVKDSLRTKLVPETKNVLAVLYVPANLAALGAEATEALSGWYRREAGGEVAAQWPPWGEGPSAPAGAC